MTTATRKGTWDAFEEFRMFKFAAGTALKRQFWGSSLGIDLQDPKLRGPVPPELSQWQRPACPFETGGKARQELASSKQELADSAVVVSVIPPRRLGNNLALLCCIQAVQFDAAEEVMWEKLNLHEASKSLKKAQPSSKIFASFHHKASFGRPSSTTWSMKNALLKPEIRSWYCLVKTMGPGVASLCSWKKGAHKVPAVELREALASAQEAAGSDRLCSYPLTVGVLLSPSFPPSLTPKFQICSRSLEGQAGAHELPAGAGRPDGCGLSHKAPEPLAGLP